VLANGIFLKFSRDDERDADRVGLRMLGRAGWDGRGMIELFELLQRESKRNPHAVDTFFSSHPSPSDRSSHLRSQLGRETSGRRDSQQFQRVRTRLQKMPPALRTPRE
jgi:predicted Zn-dependent protease